MATIAQLSEDYLRLVALVDSMPHGQMLEYLFVEDATGVRMDTRGKDQLRRAILRCGREYSVVRSVGYHLASSDTAMGILVEKLGAIDRRVKRADRATQTVQHSFLAEMPEPQQKAVIFLGSVFGAIRLAADTGKRFYGRKGEPAQLTSGLSIPIPRM